MSSETHSTEVKVALALLLFLALVTIAIVPSTINMIASFVGLIAGLALGILSGGRSA